MLDACREAIQRNDLVQLNMACAPPESAPNRRLNRLIRDELRDHPNHAGEIVLPPGDFELRRQVARRAALAGAATNPDDIVITGGTMDAVTLSLGVLCKSGDTILVESPTYFGVLQAVEHLGTQGHRDTESSRPRHRRRRDPGRRRPASGSRPRC